MVVENWVDDAILTAMGNVVIPKFEMAVKSIAESSGRGPSSMLQNPDKKNFSKNTENTALMSPSSQVDLILDQYRNVETRFVENFKDGDFPALRPNSRTLITTTPSH